MGKQFNERMVKGLFSFVLVVAFAALATALPYPGPQTDPYRPGQQNGCAAPWTQLSTGCYRFHESPMTQSEAKKSRMSQLTSLRSTLRRRTEPSLPRCRGKTLFRGKLTSGLASTIVTLRDIGFLNQLAKVSFSLTGILGSQTMLEDLEARTVPLSMNKTSGMMLIVMANQTMGGREQLFVRKVNQ